MKALDENLMRSELTITQQSEHIAKRKELWEARKQSGRNPPTSDPRQGFASATSDATGMSKRRVNEAIARAEGVTQEARDTIRGTEHDKGVVLDELKKLPASEQAKLVTFLKWIP
ncbi:hypothetical protein RUE5091_03314 [Ruegeria denitrificans]|uniref:Uncharacterized protein n=1 Tax=Ruegeria denitrificans TaxID=1715692 RepID=A0A0P1ILP8_9RHOB|nr:hypothetical protein [Ruegeria denitrificans]CUK10438.1 hypothetical protein RUE5091_03314 [Ruegeria denitrificans]